MNTTTIKAFVKKPERQQAGLLPLTTRTCKCGCGNTFQPRRRDQVYLNKQHSDFGYNHGIRKQKMEERLDVEKQLRRNERILTKYSAMTQGLSAPCLLQALQADGFDTTCYTGLIEFEDRSYFTVFTHAFLPFRHEGIHYIHIISL